MENIADHAGWMLATGLIITVISYLIGRKHGSNNCATCGISGLKLQLEEALIEIKKLCNVIQAVAERAGMTAKERLEIEAIER